MPPQSDGKKCLYHLKKLQNITKFQRKLYDSGVFQEKLNQLLLKEDTIDIKSFLKMIINLQEKKLSMLESLPLNKKMILQDRLILLKKNTLNIKSLKILDQDLTLNEKDLSPLWNKYSQDLFKNLLLPILTDLQELDLTSYALYVKTTIQNLQFCQIKKIQQQNMNLRRSLSPLLPIIPPNFTECENIKYCRKIKIFPNKEQKVIFNKCFGATRYLYNKTISIYNNRDKTQPFSLSLPASRNKIMKSNKDLLDNDPEFWMKEIPYDTRQLAIKSAFSSIKSNFELLKKGLIKKFKLSFKSKKDKKQIFHVDHRAIKNLNLFPSLLKENKKIKIKSKYKNYYEYEPKSDCIIQKDGPYYYLIIPKEKEIIRKEQPNKVISLDPGIRTFQSFYTPEGYVGDLGNNKLKEKIMKKENKIDKLKSIIDKQKKRNRGMKKRCDKLKTKVLNIVKDFHWKISSFLCKNYKTIYLPIFKSKELKNNLNEKNNRLLDLLSHYKFQEKMKHQSLKYGCNLKIVGEEYTTKTCGNCGNLNNFIGMSKEYWCYKCNIFLERDYQAARNILIKNVYGT